MSSIDWLLGFTCVLVLVWSVSGACPRTPFGTRMPVDNAPERFQTYKQVPTMTTSFSTNHVQ
ncbi:hypothetical protein CHLRE_12g484375v5 [Chlamydomonas reinhardtii]|uniref:Secreted protein n=1 Tax=Chlamydomonas reinhardtii TaxID=3055 RepID=A0A2K3D1Q0_CHLRE|nr:uncharacterized protein CHLRE_12g484375v5 [Chlamydomonas reinhardtii]PNW74447.1 hypothetical protein CHLRE_12g484375v5 [Chlamydomonas reinhardtii]